ncbi:TAXI family TRAP transporter solute-binding subunit [bacterium]|nr:TAXI family TRAP transporter solute-binding subunit [bacterium]
MLLLYRNIMIVVCFFCTLNTVFPQTTLRFATAPEGGGYYEAANILKKILEENNQNIRIEIVQTSGSVENAEKIASGSVDLALIQSDIAYYFKTGEKIFKFPADRLKGIAALYTEPIHIIINASLAIEDLNGLKGRNVSVGPQRSGTEFNATSILNIFNLSYQDIEEQFLPIGDAVTMLEQGTIDAVFLTSGIPSPILTNFKSNFKLLPLKTQTILSLRQSYPFYVGTTIPAKTYSNINEDVFTVGVRALLVCHEGLADNIVDQLLDILYDKTRGLSNKGPIGRIQFTDISNSVDGMTISLHKRATSYYEKNNVLSKFFSPYLSIILIMTFCIAIVFIIKKFSYFFVRSFFDNMYFRLVLLLLSLFIVGSIGTFYFEHNINENFDTINKTFWTSIVYMISGFEGAGPISSGGKIASILIFIGSIGILGSVTGKFASLFIDQRSSKMPKRMNEHIAICNWNNKADTIVKELHHPGAEPETEIIILANTMINEEELRKNSRYENVYFIKGDPILHDTLKAARIHHAKSIIVLANPNIDDPDPCTAIICLAIRRLIMNAVTPHIICEVMNPNKRKHVLDAGANEVVTAGLYRTGIMLQSALNKHLSDVYHQLLVISDDTNEFYFIDNRSYPVFLLGKTFKELVMLLNDRCEKNNPLILVGIRRGNKVMLNPKNSSKDTEKSFNVLKENDVLIVMAFNKPNLKKMKLTKVYI